MLVSGLEQLLCVVAVHVQGPGHEGRLGSERQRHRVERVVDRPVGRRLGHLSRLRGRGVLALGQPVDLVVEQQDLDVDVPSQGVDEVVATDGEGIAVTGDHPHRQVGAGGCDPGGDGRGPAVDRVHPVGADVVGEPRSAADPGHEYELLPGTANAGEELLDRGEDRVVAAAGAPPNLLIGLEVGTGVRGGGHLIISRILSAISETLNGSPATLLRPWASTRNSALITLRSWPVFSSGIRILS